MMLLSKAEIDSALQVLSSTVAFALQRVGMDSCVCAPRSQFWQPVKVRAGSKSAQQFEPILLRRLRRLHTRFAQLQCEPDHACLHRKCFQGLVAIAHRIPELHDWHNLDGIQLLQALSEACLRLDTEHKGSRIRAWRASSHGNLAKKIGWVKRRTQLLAEVSDVAPSVDVFVCNSPSLACRGTAAGPWIGVVIQQ